MPYNSCGVTQPRACFESCAVVAQAAIIVKDFALYSDTAKRAIYLTQIAAESLTSGPGLAYICCISFVPLPYLLQGTCLPESLPTLTVMILSGASSLLMDTQCRKTMNICFVFIYSIKVAIDNTGGRTVSPALVFDLLLLHIDLCVCAPLGLNASIWM